MSRVFFTALALALAACSPATGDAATQSTQDAAASVHPISGLRTVPITITHADKAHSFRVEVASSPQEQAKGLMFRNAMGPDEGMIFPLSTPRTASFWMRNTVIPLDMIFIGTDGRIRNIRTAQPYDETPQPSDGAVAAVLELNAGRTRELGIEPGDQVSW